MSDETRREALSALVDGELPEAEAERLLDAMRDDPLLREQWRRHHALSALLADSASAPVDARGLCGRIGAALDREPAPPEPVPRWGFAGPARPLTGLALAAGVALVAVVVVLGLRDDAAPVPIARVTEPAPAAATRLTWNDARPAVEDRLNAYLLTHNEYLSGGVRGMLPYARVVGYDPGN